ncbi:tail fiber domain-containing protein [Christensenella timonensis]|uniref:tail fiber domain-containing protein n=1 Tax=Christensenella timonensis TaxID=1816678 RepID=UPI00093C3E3D|nr:tail fiber domain-containing protein [Christensenella timonensis]
MQTLFASNVTGSAKRLKENIKPLTDEEAHKILTMLPVSFTWKKDSPFCGDSISFIADDVAEIDERFVYHSMDERGNRQVEGLQVNPFLAAYGLLLKEHEKRLEELQKKVEKFAALSNLLIEKGVCTQKEIDNL